VASLTDAAVEQIKAMIVRGELRPGDRLPAEHVLADQLGLSRGSLREAIRALSVMKVIDVRRGDGTYVTSLAPELLLEAINFVVDLHRDETVMHFLQLRSFVEPECCAMAALHIDADTLAWLAVLLEDADALARAEVVDHAQLMVNDQQFHAVLNAAGGNPVAAAIVEATAGITTRARVTRSMVEIGAELTTVDDHQAIFAAVAAGDPYRARQRAAAHIARTEDWVRAQLASEYAAGATTEPGEILLS